ncbi:MAG: DUF5134 domain-containing protein [Propionibacteriaceae bacterium]|nr:DUF5134 domain-containing protein [Propionibacteriaceae bacterium]
MFTLTDMPVKFAALLILFAFSTIWSLYQLARRQTGPTLVSNLAHLAMSIVMLLMVPRTLWQPFSAAIPLPALVGFFGIFALWFVGLGVRGIAAGGGLRRHGWHAVGHGAMFGAMTWHLAAMMVRHGPGAHGGGDPATAGGHGHGDMAAMEPHLSMADPAPLQAAGAGEQTMLVATIGVPFMTYLLLAAIWNLKNVIAPSAPIQDHLGHEAAGHGHYAAGNPRLAAAADFAMNFGMFWMSTGLMVALLPFFAHLSF